MSPDERRGILTARAAAHPDGLPVWKLTGGFAKPDALQFWNDAKSIGLVKVGVTPRGARMFAFPASGPRQGPPARVDEAEPEGGSL